MARFDSVEDSNDKAPDTPTAAATTSTTEENPLQQQPQLIQQIPASRLVGRSFWRYFPEDDVCLRAVVSSVDKNRKFVITYPSDENKATRGPRGKSTLKEVGRT